MIQHYTVKMILDTYVLIPKKPTIHVHRMIKINAVGVFLFNLMCLSHTYEDILKTFAETYALSCIQAEEDLNHFISRLKEHHIIDHDMFLNTSYAKL